MPSSRSGPSIAIAQRLRSHARRARIALQVGRACESRGARAARTRSFDPSVDDALPPLDRVAIAVLLDEHRALVEQRADVRRIEAQHARERVHRVALAAERQQRLAEGDQRVEVIGIALQQLDQEVSASPGRPSRASQRRQLERRLGVRRHGVERRDELQLRLAILPFRLEQPRELKAHDGEILIELAARAGTPRSRRRCRRASARCRRSAAECRRASARRAAPPRARRARRRDRPIRRTPWPQASGLRRRRDRRASKRSAIGRASARATETHERTTPRRSCARRMPGSSRSASRYRSSASPYSPCFAKTSPSSARPSARALPRDIARLISADARSYSPFDRKSVAIANGDESVLRTVAAACAGVRRWREPGEQRVERLRIEAEVRDRRIGRPLAAEVRLDRDVGILVLDVHRELELLRDVVRIELERALRLAQRALEVAEIREREAHVVVRFGEIRPRLDRARERVARIFELAQLGRARARCRSTRRDAPAPCSAPGGTPRAPAGTAFARLSSSARLSRAFDERRARVERAFGTRRAPRRPRRGDRARRRGCCARSRTTARRRARDDSSPPRRRSARPDAARRRARSTASGSPVAAASSSSYSAQRLRRLAHQQVHLGHRLQHEIALLAALERDSDTRAAPRRSSPCCGTRGRGCSARAGPRRVTCSSRLAGRLAVRRARTRCGSIARFACARDSAGLSWIARRVDRLRVLVTPDVAEHEAHQVERVVVFGIQLDGALQRDAALPRSGRDGRAPRRA